MSVLLSYSAATTPEALSTAWLVDTALSQRVLVLGPTDLSDEIATEVCRVVGR